VLARLARARLVVVSRADPDDSVGGFGGSAVVVDGDQAQTVLRRQAQGEVSSSSARRERGAGGGARGG
jgi:hypothetical protein